MCVSVCDGGVCVCAACCVVAVCVCVCVCGGGGSVALCGVMSMPDTVNYCQHFISSVVWHS